MQKLWNQYFQFQWNWNRCSLWGPLCRYIYMCVCEWFFFLFISHSCNSSFDLVCIYTYFTFQIQHVVVHTAKYCTIAFTYSLCSSLVALSACVHKCFFLFLLLLLLLLFFIESIARDIILSIYSTIDWVKLIRMK